jgi:hypothetical protein
MATKRVPAVDMPSPTDDDAQEMADLNAAEGGDLFKAIDDIRGTAGAKVRIVRIQPNDGWCEDMDVAEWSIDTLKNRWGAGTYKLRIVGPKGFLPGGGSIKIAAAPGKTTNGASSDFQSFLEAQQRRDAERSAKIWELAMISVPALIGAFVNRQAPQSDIPALISALKPQPGPTIAELTGALANIQTLSGGANKESSFDQILKVMDAVKDFADDKEGGGKGESNWIDLVRDLIKAAPDALKPMLEARMQAMSQNRPGAPIAPASVPRVNPASAPATAAPGNVSSAAPPFAGAAGVSSPNNTESQNMLAMFKPVIVEKLRTIAGWAKSDRDPVMYAQVFCDDVGEMIAKYIPQPQALEYLRNEKWFDYVCEWAPELKEHHEWCEHFRNELIEIVSLSDDPAPADEPEPDDDPTADHPPVKPAAGGV